MASNSPCAACKFLRRKCIPDCPFAPYFPPDNPVKFTNVHKVFGASNVSKLLSELHTHAQKEDAVNSLAYEAQARLEDPVYGCVGLITNLSRQLSRVQQDLYSAKLELSQYLGPNAMAMSPIIQPTSNPYVIQQYQHHHQANASPSMGAAAYGIQPPHHMSMGMGLAVGGPSQPHFIVREPYHRRIDYEAQQLAVAYAREQELMRNLEQQQQLQAQQRQQHQHQQQQQQQIDLVRYQNYIGGFDASGVAELNNQVQAVHVSDGMTNTVPIINFDSQFQQQQQINESEEQQAQELMPHHEQQLLLTAAKSEEDNTSIGPPT
ncbi:hypothetical protein Sjap_016801 [Stephania japonica]|uniref:LOB domain-containing protein n=1 Tax=Stephania japonica TaxID=461633 RepID=A0AAP0I4Y0_9MAGN